jgi:hypothetical protein
MRRACHGWMSDRIVRLNRSLTAAWMIALRTVTGPPVRTSTRRRPSAR